jgi:hypothetical protein
VKQFERSSMAMTELRSSSGSDLATAARIAGHHRRSAELAGQDEAEEDEVLHFGLQRSSSLTSIALPVHFACFAMNSTIGVESSSPCG